MIKQWQAQIVYSLNESLKWGRPSRSMPIPPNVVEEREALYETIKKLNQREPVDLPSLLPVKPNEELGWILRSAIVWHKPNPMPESTRDRPTSAYEMLFLFAKCEETPQFWTHRDGPGTRIAPAPDYRWQDVATGFEYAQEPTDYSEDMTECPSCAGAGEIYIQAGQVSMFDGIPQMVLDCDKCDGEGKVNRWKRVNLWMGHDYFYDADAVREPLTGGTNRGRKDGKHRPGKTIISMDLHRQNNFIYGG